MKAKLRPRMTASGISIESDRVISDVNKYLDARIRQEAIYRSALISLTLYQEFGFGEKRLGRFWAAYNKIFDRESLNFHDADNDILIKRLKEMGLNNMVEDLIQADKDVEEAKKDSIFQFRSK